MTRGRRGLLALIVLVAVMCVVGVGMGVVWLAGLGSGEPEAEATAPPARSIVTPTPRPTPTGFPENTTSYAQEELPVVDVFAVIDALPVDDDPHGALTTFSAQPLAAGAPVFADPEAEPVAWLPREQQFEGTVVPVIERQEHWVRVLLVGRSAVPSQGSSAQVTGWLRAEDVQLRENRVRIEVSLDDRTVDIVTMGDPPRQGEAPVEVGREHVAADFASGAEGTPTPVGRSFVMMTRTAELGYTRGHPLVYLSVQSPTLDGFAGQSVAVTAFHYHDARSGPISNGCIRLDGDAIERLATLPAGTPVHISG